MTEIKCVNGVIEKITESKTKTDKDIHYYKIAGVSYSGFGEAKHKEGDNIRLNYTENGQYKNIASTVLISEGNPSIEEETVEEPKEYSPDRRQKEITLGQSMNMALRHLHENQLTALPDEFDVHFKVETKRFFRLLQELQRDLL